MEIKKVDGSIFEVIKGEDFKNGDIFIGQHISSDFSMNVGISVKINEKLKIKNTLKEYVGKHNTKIPDCILVDGILSLVTKKYHYNKSTYDSFAGAFEEMKKICKEENIKNIALPMLGCGEDKLIWSHIEKKLKKTFKDTDVTFYIYENLD